VVVLRRANARYDFGSWASVMAAVPEVLDSPTVLLTNDSLVGPFSSMRHVLDSAAGSHADVWGAIRSEQFQPHLQSYMIAFRGGILREPTLRRFWSRLPDVTDKLEIVRRYELGLSTLFWTEGYSTEAFIEGREFARWWENPTIMHWNALLDLGFPFVKRQLLRDPTLAPDGERIVETVQSLYRVDPYEWVGKADRGSRG
jgi:lipopolysaccharide biosynthesis protein